MRKRGHPGVRETKVKGYGGLDKKVLILPGPLPFWKIVIGKKILVNDGIGPSTDNYHPFPFQEFA